jgi:perosamine synthetase
MAERIPVNTPHLKGNELKYVTECIETGWISSEGPFVEKFENGFAEYLERSYGIAVANGSAALDIAVKALNIGPGDEVIIPTFTIISPALSVVRAGAKPVFVDSDPLTWNMNAADIESRITAATKAIIVVHIYGLPADIDHILALAIKYKLRVIEDAAEMHGQTFKGKKCGSFGDLSTFSFYPNKNITTGEGGMIVCNDEALAKRCRKLRNLAFEPAGRRFVHNELGWNYRLTNIQAALGLAQLEQIGEFLKRKMQLGNFYQQHLSFLEGKGYQLPLQKTSYATNHYWVFGLVAPSEDECNNLVQHLKTHNIETRPFFWCMHEQPILKELRLVTDEAFPVAEKLARNGFYLPSGLGIEERQLQRVAEVITLFY